MARLGEICTIQSGGTPSRGNKDYWDNGTIPWVKISDFSGKYLDHTSERITQAGLDNSSAKFFSKGTILYTIFATLGETCILDIDATTNQAIAGLKLKDDSVSLDYLYYYLLSKKEYVNQIGRGVAQNNINMKILRDMEIYIPSAEDQAKATKALNKIYELIALRKEQLAKLDQLVKSQFVEMFENCGYKKVTVHSVLDTAFWLMPATPEFIVNGKVPYITSKNIKNGRIDFDNVKYISQEAFRSISSNRPTRKGDILVSMIGTLGQIAVIQDNRDFYGQNLYLLRINNAVVDTTFFCEFFNSDTVQNELQGKRNQSTQAYLKANHVEGLLLPLPPMELQKAFATFVEQTDQLKMAIQQSLDKLELLKKSLMQQYFG